MWIGSFGLIVQYVFAEINLFEIVKFSIDNFVDCLYTEVDLRDITKSSTDSAEISLSIEKYWSPVMPVMFTVSHAVLLQAVE